jgi:hypothetical protein
MELSRASAAVHCSKSPRLKSEFVSSVDGQGIEAVGSAVASASPTREDLRLAARSELRSAKVDSVTVRNRKAPSKGLPARGSQEQHRLAASKLSRC